MILLLTLQITVTPPHGIQDAAVWDILRWLLCEIRAINRAAYNTAVFQTAPSCQFKHSRLASIRNPAVWLLLFIYDLFDIKARIKNK